MTPWPPARAHRLTCLLLLASGSAQAFESVPSFGTNPGNLVMYAHLPANAPAGAALVLLLHGCSQTASEYAQKTGWLERADALGFALVAAEQRSANHLGLCFNWFQPGDTDRGSGEAASIAQMIETMLQAYDLSAARVFVTGVSSGGAMTAAMLAAYPELFAGGGLLAGIPYGCASSQLEAFTCMSSGRDWTPATWGNAVRAATSHTGPWPKVAIWHGSTDSTVAPSNATESSEQWLDVHGLGLTTYVDESLGVATHRAWPSIADAVVDLYTLPNMGHGVPIDPSDDCGTAGTYFVDVGLCATRVLAALWQLAAQPPADGGDDGGAADGVAREDGAPADAVAPADPYRPGDGDGPAGDLLPPRGSETDPPTTGCACHNLRPALWPLAALLALRRRRRTTREEPSRDATRPRRRAD